jgi:protein-export membrane protein SecD
MRALWIALAAAVAAVVVSAAAILVVVFPDRIMAYLPGWAQPWVAPDGPQVVLQIEPEGGVELGQAVEESIRIIRRRFDDLGRRAVVAVQKQEPDRILVHLPRSVDLLRSIEMLTRRGKLEFRRVDITMTAEQAMREGPPAGSEILYEGPDKMLPNLVEKRVAVSGRDVVDAQVGFDQRANEPVLNFRFNTSGARAFAQLTQENVGRRIAIVFDSAVLSAPVIRDPIVGGQGQISGNFTVQQADNMAIMLRAGELPGRLRVIEQRASQ